MVCQKERTVMAPTRGVKTLLKASTPGRAGTYKGHRCYRTLENKTLKGITKRLATKLFSDGVFPESAIEGDGRGGCWRGRGGGRRRGTNRSLELHLSLQNQPKPNKRPLRSTRTVQNWTVHAFQHRPDSETAETAALTNEATLLK
jgi:hypothetical protein